MKEAEDKTKVGNVGVLSENKLLGWGPQAGRRAGQMGVGGWGGGCLRLMS